jgi:hypothetical protein
MPMLKLRAKPLQGFDSLEEPNHAVRIHQCGATIHAAFTPRLLALTVRAETAANAAMPAMIVQGGYP